MKADKQIRNQEMLSNIRDILEQRGITQRDLAMLVGKKEAEISRWMSGKFNISHQSQLKIEKALGQPISADSTFRGQSGEVRIGIIGTGNIAERFMHEVIHVKDVTVTAAYNPENSKTAAFCQKHGIANCCSSPQELLAHVDAVYVASPVDTHCQYTGMALENGRHVLCEMPFTMHVKEAADLLKAAAKKNLVLLTALKTAYCPSFEQMIMMTKTGIIGQVVDVTATVTNLLPEDSTPDFANERMVENLSYPLLVFFKLLGFGYRSIHSFTRKTDDKMLFTNTTIEYKDAIASLKVGIGVKSEGSLVVSGTQGYIYVPAPWWKPDYFEVRFENPADNKKYFFPYEAAGLRYEIQALRDSINHISTRKYISREEILKIIELQEKIFKTK